MALTIWGTSTAYEFREPMRENNKLLFFTFRTCYFRHDIS